MLCGSGTAGIPGRTSIAGTGGAGIGAAGADGPGPVETVAAGAAEDGAVITIAVSGVWCIPTDAETLVEIVPGRRRLVRCGVLRTGAARHQHRGGQQGREIAPAAHRIPFGEPDPDTSRGTAWVTRPVGQPISGRGDFAATL